ncbi:LacI family DNA-binding transcriptional regulator [Flexithrix dorotheae]|uniref:LacI family DNA-binding transcriptional regulator n=1 Tax=Flexithrix dorotheae TaxID=70993 RepID=UPI00035C7820|nr:LacI family DNA-binding transcriptional regulator [Flexithrix dorotheae]
MKPKRVTIKDLAKALNVSPSTISRALQDSYQIGEETKKAVWELAKKWNYKPNLVAKRLIKQKSFTVGVIVPEVSYYFNATLIMGLEDILLKEGFNLIICQTHESYEREILHFEYLMANQVDGIISSISGETQQMSHLHNILEGGTPLVLFDRGFNVPNISKVMIDNVEAGRVAVSYLIETGCKRIAYLQGPESLPIGNARKKGYIKALAEAGIPFDEKLVSHCKFGSDMGYSNAKKMLGMKEPPDAFFCINDRIGMGTLAAIREKGLSIPDDVAVIGFNDEPYAKLLNPRLTTIEQPAFKMGQEAAKMFLYQLKTDEPEIQTKILPTKLIIRESTMGKC